MALVPNFCGGFYQTLSPVMGADTAVNVYTETREVPGSAKQITMYGRPGLRRFATVPTQGCRGWFSEDGRTLTVVGGTLYDVDVETQIATALGTIADDGAPVFFASNGRAGEQIGVARIDVVA